MLPLPSNIHHLDYIVSIGDPYKSHLPAGFGGVFASQGHPSNMIITYKNVCVGEIPWLWNSSIAAWSSFFFRAYIISLQNQ